MKRTAFATGLALALTAAFAAPVLAKGPGDRGNGHGFCPPGLAKKAVPCVPPGQAKHRIGDRFDYDDYRRIDDYDRFDLPPIGGNEGYYRDGRIVYRVDRTTRRVLAIFELAQIIAGD